MVTAYLAYPLSDLYRLDRALESRDAATVGDLVDWAMMRQQLKTGLAGSLLGQGREAGRIEALGAAVGLALSPLVATFSRRPCYSQVRESGRSGTLLGATIFPSSRHQCVSRSS